MRAFPVEVADSASVGWSYNFMMAIGASVVVVLKVGGRCSSCFVDIFTRISRLGYCDCSVEGLCVIRAVGCVRPR